MNKRFVFTGIFILLALCASAQATDVPAADSLRRIGDVDTGPVTMRRAADGEGMVLEVAGFGITLGQASGGEKQKVKALPRVCGSFLSGVEMGFNFLTGADYAGYPAEAGDFLDVRGGNSFHFGITPVGLSVALDRKRRFEFSTGLRYTVDNYRLSDNSITLGRDGGMVVPLPLDDKADKSKFRITSLGFPLQFSFDPVRHLRVAVVGYCDFTLGANAIYKKPKEKNSLSGVNPFQFGLGGSVSYRGFGVYVRYGVTSLFKSSAGPVCHPVSFGVCVFM
ncbi:outer membrane beta-barrel protein [Alistipes sp. D31t1_170403_E11]|uniref:outer membrane beta-barrel protein n=1 Tax=Alistipes sp. D31t1_170403_E11 TaxID=2787128 RepID=UPI00189A4C15|nr:outer membrane beta-barrel protein [Alistipes sp. D31t1_170403_E11]